MDILAGLTGLLVGAFAAWLVMREWAAAEISRLRTRLEERINFWQGETERARSGAAQVAERTAAWVAGCERGRDDALSVVRALADAGQDTGPRTTARSG